MEELANLIANYGVMIVIVALFLWDWVTNKKTTTESLKQMAEANKNIATSLDLLKQSSSNIESKTDKIYEKIVDGK